MSLEIKAVYSSAPGAQRPVCPKPISLEGYVKRTNGDWTYSDYVAPDVNAVYGLDEKGNEIPRFFSMCLSGTVDYYKTGFSWQEGEKTKIKSLYPRECSVVPADQFEEAKNELGTGLSISDEKVRAVFAKYFNTRTIAS